MFDVNSYGGKFGFIPTVSCCLLANNRLTMSNKYIIIIVFRMRSSIQFFLKITHKCQSAYVKTFFLNFGENIQTMVYLYKYAIFAIIKTKSQPFSVIKKVILSCLLFLFSVSISFAQTSILHESDVKKQFYTDEIVIDLPQKRRVIEQDDLAHQFAVPYTMNHPVKHIADPDIKTEYARYLVEIKATDARAINFSVTGLMQANIRAVYVKNTRNKKVYGPFFADQNAYDITAFPVFNTESLLIEFIANKPVTGEQLKITKAGLTYNEKYPGLSGDCNVDVNCTEGLIWQNAKRAVVKLIIDNTYICSGTLLNTTSNDEKPYLLTANHCINSPWQAANTVFYFNYESKSCNDPASFYPDPNDFVMNGAKLKATKYDYWGRLDFSLLLLNETIPNSFSPYFAGWSASESAPEHTVCLHHPQGDVKKISIDFNTAETASFSTEFDAHSHWRILKWDIGVTEGGSSGSALFNQNYQVVGDLTGGEAACDYPYNDYYTKFHLAFDKYADSSEQLKYWLDPEATEVRSYAGFPDKNIETDEEYVLYPNPADEVFYIKSNKLLYDVWIIIYNQNGFVEWRNYYSNVNKMLAVQAPSSLKGLYVIELITHDNRVRKKIFFK